MANLTPNMQLVTWDLLTDFFSHTDLLDNWSKVDGHDHVPVGSGGNGGTPIPSAGILNGAITTAKLAADAVGAAQIQSGAVGTSELAGSGVTYDKLDATALPVIGTADSATEIQTTSTTFQDALTVTVTTRARSVLLWMSGQAQTAATARLKTRFTVDGIAAGRIPGVGPLTTGQYGNITNLAVVTGLTAASHTFKVQYNTDNSGQTVYFDHRTFLVLEL